MNIALVPAEHINDTWPIVEGMLKKAAIRTGGRYHVIDVYADLMSGKQTLWVAFGDDKIIIGCVTLSVQEYPMLRACRVEYLGGKDFHLWMQDGFATVTKYAKELGCTRMEMSVRTGLGPLMEQLGGEKTSINYDFNLE